MQPEFDQEYCNACRAIVNKRDLKTEYVVIKKCRSCNAELGREEMFSTVTNEEVTVQEDASAISAWLDSIAPSLGLTINPIRERERFGEYIWSVDGAHPRWECEVVYRKDKPHVVEIRLVMTEHSGTARDKRHERRAAFARHGLESHGVSEGDNAWWGAAQLVSTSALCEELFPAIVSRLAGAMEVAERQG